MVSAAAPTPIHKPQRLPARQGILPYGHQVTRDDLRRLRQCIGGARKEADRRYRTAAARSHVGNQSFQGLCVHCHFGGMAA